MVFRLCNYQAFTIELTAVEFLQSYSNTCFIHEFDQCESFRTIAALIRGKEDIQNHPDFGKEIQEFRLRGILSKVSDKYFSNNVLLSISCDLPSVL